MSSSVVCGSGKPLFFGSANFWIVVAVAHCNVATDDLKRKKERKKKSGKSHDKAGEDIYCANWRDYLKGFNSSRRKYQSRICSEFFMKINLSIFNCHV